jgi:hypothetical protein
MRKMNYLHNKQKNILHIKENLGEESGKTELVMIRRLKSYVTKQWLVSVRMVLDEFEKISRTTARKNSIHLK